MSKGNRYKMSKIKLLGGYFFDVAVNCILFLLYRFPRWHIFATSNNRAYKKIALELARTVEADYYIDFGAGLGDVSHNLLNAILLDNDRRLIQAARRKHPNIDYQYLDWKLGTFQDFVREDSQKICVLALNLLEPDEVKNFFSKLECFKSDLFVVMDVLSIQCINPQDFGWIPRDLKLDNYLEIARIYAKDSVRDVVLYKRFGKH